MKCEAKEYLKAMQQGCGCPIDETLDAQVAQFAHRASNVNATAMEQFQLLVASQNSVLLKLTADLTTSKPGT